jgi:four helix bundle protein
MRRAAASIASNIAEGCGRRSNRELLTFLYITAGSGMLTRLITFLRTQPAWRRKEGRP